MPKKKHTLDVSVDKWTKCYATDDEVEWDAIIKAVYGAAQKIDAAGKAHFAESGGEKCEGLKTLTVGVKSTHSNGVVIDLKGKLKLPADHVHAAKDTIMAAFEPHKHCEVVK